MNDKDGASFGKVAKARMIPFSKKPKWADGEHWEIWPMPDKSAAMVLRWPGWAHRFVFADLADIPVDGVMDQVKALWLGLVPSDWDLIGTVHAQRVPFSVDESALSAPGVK